MEKKISDFFQNAMVHDMQCIAYAYRPINTINGQRIPFLNPDSEDHEEPGCAFVVHPYKQPSSDSSSSSSSSGSSSSTTSNLPSLSYPELPISLDDNQQAAAPVEEESSSSKAVTQQRRSSRDSQWSTSSDSTSDYSFEEDEPVNEEEEETFYKEVVKGQIFLGMTAMCHQPKPVGFVISFSWIYMYS